MSKLVAPFLFSGIVGVSLLALGCSASLQVGGAEPKHHKAAPPPPAATPAPTPAPAPPKLNRPIRMVGNKIDLPGPIVFETGSDKLKPESEPVLEVVLQFMNTNKAVNLLRVEGHTDNDGTPPSNMDLSKRRTISVVHWLTGKGVDCKRLIPVGFGQTKPIADNATEAGKAQNRRVDFIKASENGKAVTDDKGKALPVDGGGETSGDPCK